MIRQTDFDLAIGALTAMKDSKEPNARQREALIRISKSMTANRDYQDARVLTEKERALKLQFQNERDRGEWIKRDEVRQSLAVISNVLRSLSVRYPRQLARDAGTEAQAMLNESVHEITREVTSRFGFQEKENGNGHTRKKRKRVDPGVSEV